MSHNVCIRISLDLKDKNITFNKFFCEEKVIKGVKSKLYNAKLSYIPNVCTCCGILNEGFKVVKNGFLTSRVTWLGGAHTPTYLRLKKQRFLCRECHGTFVATSPEIKRGYYSDFVNSSGAIL